MATLTTIVLTYAAFPMNLLSNPSTLIAPNDHRVTYEGRWGMTKSEAVADCDHKSDSNIPEPSGRKTAPTTIRYDLLGLTC